MFVTKQLTVAIGFRSMEENSVKVNGYRQASSF